MRAREGVVIRHIETGLCLDVDGNGGLILTNSNELKIQNTQRYSCPLSELYNWEPVYIEHTVKICSNSADQLFGIERYEGKIFIRLFCLQSLPFLSSLV